MPNALTAVSRTDGGHHWIPMECLQPLPSPALVAANARVAEADEAYAGGRDPERQWEELTAARKARRALLTPSLPPDPVAELLLVVVDAINMATSNQEGSWITFDKTIRIRSAIAAVEAARKKKGKE